MKKCLCLIIAALCINFSVKAAAGDTTWVQANNVELTYYNTYDTTIAFPAPGTSYRKIYMIFTLGKYMCAGYTYGTGSVPWCGDWDYTIQNYLMTPGGDTLELGRLISPYANNEAPRTPWTWKQQYVFDVTDYASLLQNSETMRILYSGYSGGFTGNIQFMFIEGTPDRNVLGVKSLWNGSFTYGDTVGADANDINTHFTALSEVAPTGTQTADLKFTVTGHGSDSVEQCCEFAAHNYQVMLNGSSIATQLIWREDCGNNELYPQSGTWNFRRANWCPGALVNSKFQALPGITSGSSFNVGVQFDPYVEPPTSSSYSYGLYTTFGTLIYYGGLNKTLDASIDDIIAPTSNANYFRENPSLGQPTLKIHNSGSTNIDSITFQYSVQGYAPQTYTWVGNLASLADTQISLAPLLSLDSIAGLSGTYNFTAEIVSVNGIADNDQTNDTMRSQFITAPVWPSAFQIQMYTSNLNAGTSSTVAETSWAIYNMDNTIVMQRDNCGFNQLYADTLNLPVGYYHFVITDAVFDYDGTYDGNFYGLQTFIFEYSGSPYVPGYLNVNQVNAAATPIPMNGYTYVASGSGFNNDFGQSFSQYFYVASTAASTAVKNVNSSVVAINAFPNPAKDMVNVTISGLSQVDGAIQILDELGRVVSTTVCNNASQQVNISSLVNGVYTVLFINNDSQSRLQTKLVIAK